MGQKVNPIIFQLKKTKNWSSKYFEKKIVEHSFYSKIDFEIRNFINKFFKDQKIQVIINNCKLHFLNSMLINFS
jgi:hypothetical protein